MKGVVVSLPTVSIIGSPVTALPFEAQIGTIANWAKARLSKVVCVANVHMLVEAYWHGDFGSVLRKADIVTPDGMPLVWMIRLFGFKNQDRVAGLDILTGVCNLAQSAGVSVYFLGPQPDVLARMQAKLRKDFPMLSIAGMESLPFRQSIEVDQALIDRVNASGAGIVLIALGCPKQEHWMAMHQNKINAVMIGLGGAFLVYAGIHKRAPRWARENGLEWLYRLIQEPRRLWRRYALTIPPFLYLALKQIFLAPRSPELANGQAQSK
jgi:N-acetylglucosaminyldiphosphoundecaprenol N-acetyl-beta-D-mannosaminyltransferase